MNRPNPLRLGKAASAVSLAAAIVGCGGGSEDQGSLRSAIKGDVGRVSAQQGEGVGFDRHLSSDLGGRAVTDAEAPADDFDSPLAGDANFFTPPNVESTSKQVIKSDRGHAPVRLLGFVGDDAKETQLKKAILKIGQQMVTVGQGDSIEGIELLSIQGRSVTMQRDRDRWTLSLFEQPLVNKPQPQRAWSRSAPRKRSSKAATTHRARPHSIQPAAMEPTSHQPPIPVVPDIEIPEPPEPPDLSNLPGMNDVPGI